MKISLSIVSVAVIFFFVFSLLATTAYAAGGKVRGEKATGPAYQLGECPFNG